MKASLFCLLALASLALSVSARDSGECNSDTEFDCPANEKWGRPPCIPKQWVCDGKPDCVDGRDENTTTLGCPEPEACTDEEFQCDNKLCIKEDWVCDSDNDCGDGSDESLDCKKKHRKCTESEFQCPSAKCIEKRFRCDGENDCGDNADEQNCEPPPKCASDQFQCKNMDCISLLFACNNVPDCSDDSDEPTHCNFDECSKVEFNRCGHKCINTPIGYECACNQGYKLMPDKKDCEDINECVETPEVCSQQCHNTPGSFVCECDYDYYTKVDNSTCKRTDTKETPWIFFSDKYDVRRMTTDASKHMLMQQDLRRVSALDFDVQEKEVYFADVSAKVIYKAKINGSEKIPIIKHDSQSSFVEGIAVDWVGRKLYWLDSRTKHLDVAELDGRNRRTLKNDGINGPKAIVVHPKIGYVYFTDSDSTGLQSYIGRIGMDGSNFSRVLTYADKVIWPNALTIDYFTNRIYWADAHLDYIAFADADGANKHEIIRGPQVPLVIALSIFDDFMYWTDLNIKAIIKAHKLTAKNFTYLRNTTHKPYALKTHKPWALNIFHSLRQIKYPTQCQQNNGGCSHLCLLSPKKNGIVGTKCVCPNDSILDKNGKTCTPN